MANNTVDNLTLQELNDREIRKLVVPIVYLSILMVIGIPGNLTVLIIYRQKYSKSVYRTIIWNLALVDFVFCTLTFPFNIGRLIRYYTFTKLWVCKMFTTIIIFFVMGSSHLLVTLAIHRFRQVCMPLKKQITVLNVMYRMFGGFLLAVVLDIPQGILQPLDHENLGNNITGYVCAVSFHSSIYEGIYNGFLICLFVSYTLILFILYILIGRRLYLQRKTKEGAVYKSTKSEEISSKITKIAVTVSAVFALSYVPLFVLKVVAGEIDQKELNVAEFAVLKVFERSYAFNHVANPFIYAFYDNRFRHKLKMLFTVTCCRNPINEQTKMDERSVTKDLESPNSVDSTGAIEKTVRVNRLKKQLH